MWPCQAEGLGLPCMQWHSLHTGQVKKRQLLIVHAMICLLGMCLSVPSALFRLCPDRNMSLSRVPVAVRSVTLFRLGTSTMRSQLSSGPVMSSLSRFCCAMFHKRAILLDCRSIDKKKDMGEYSYHDFMQIKALCAMPIYELSYHKLAQKSSFFSSEPLKVSDRVVVALEQGQVLARVVAGPREDRDTCGEDPVPSIVRKASPEDLAQEESNREFAGQAARFWKQCVQTRGLEMKLVDVEVFLDRSKLIFYFTALSRIDFRELVKDLVHEYRVRIEFRQIGVRHETQMIGAVGNCGMVCCCRRYLHQFAPVTIRMAKEQDLFLNPAKVSGICGRLLCCLAYEQESYEKFHNESPRLGKRYQTRNGPLRVIRTNMFHNSVTCLTESGEELRFSLEEWNALEPRRMEGQVRDSEQGGAPCDEGLEACDEAQAQQRPHGRRSRGTAPQARPGTKPGERPARPAFVTGRVSFRQQGHAPQETWKKAAGLASMAQAAGRGSREQPRQGDQPRRPDQPLMRTRVRDLSAEGSPVPHGPGAQGAQGSQRAGSQKPARSGKAQRPKHRPQGGAGLQDAAPADQCPLRSEAGVVRDMPEDTSGKMSGKTTGDISRDMPRDGSGTAPAAGRDQGS